MAAGSCIAATPLEKASSGNNKAAVGVVLEAQIRGLDFRVFMLCCFVVEEYVEIGGCRGGERGVVEVSSWSER